MIPAPDRDPPSLTFKWSAREANWLRLAAAALVAAGIFSALFVGFRIITPDVTPVSTRPHQILVLNPNRPSELALIHQAMDRSFPLIPTDSISVDAPAVAALPSFRPPILSYDLRLRPMPSGSAVNARPPYLSLDFAPPARVASARPVDGPQTEPTPPPRLRIKVAGDVAPRLPKPAFLENLPLVDMEKALFRVAVDPRGQVLFALPLLSSEDQSLMQRLREEVVRLKFTPNPAQVQWGQVSFEWQPEAIAHR